MCSKPLILEQFDKMVKQKILPKRWQKFDDLLLVPADASLSGLDSLALGTVLYSLQGMDFKGKSRTDKEYDVSRIAQQNPILDNDIRTPGARLIYGEGTEVIQKENGISYSFDFTKSMFSRGNISEKIRFSKLDVEDQVIVDLFAGLGYWVLQESAHYYNREKGFSNKKLSSK